MYTLRKIIEGQEECNFNLGNSYALVEKSKNPERFRKDFEIFFEGKIPHTDDECYAFISGENGRWEPLWKSQFNYIMTESGKTFSNLSLK